jgi:hypothetical protein
MIRTATSLGIKPLWSHNNGSIGEDVAAQIGAPAEGMLLAAPFPTFRDTKNPGIRTWVAQMKAAGKDSPADLKPNGLNSWLAVHGIAKIAAKLSNLTNATLTAALRKQTTPIDLFGLVKWAPGKKGPAAYPRLSNPGVTFLQVKNGQEVSWGAKLPVLYPLALQKFTR